MKQKIRQYLGGVFAVVAAVAVCGGVLWAKARPIAACKNEDFSQWVAMETVHSIGKQNSDEKRVFLTFDDGPSKTTEQILKILKEKNVKASFFVIAAENNEEHLPLLSQIEQEGHSIALHTCTHEYPEIYSSTAAYWQDIEKLESKIAPYLHTKPKWLRFPGGSTNTVSRKYGGSGLMEKLVEQAEQKGYLVLDWNVSAEDAVGGRRSADAIFNRIVKDSKNKNTCVVLMHDTKETKTTAQALPAIIDWYQQQGYRFCTLNEEMP